VLEDQSIVLQEKMAHCDRPRHDFNKALEAAIAFLEQPLNLWRSPRFEDKRAVLRFAFGERLVYFRGQGFRVPKLARAFGTAVTPSPGS